MNMQVHIRIVHRSLGIIVLVMLLAACGSAAPSTPAAVNGPVVELRDNLFHPAELAVPVGTTVSWQWNDGFFGGHDLIMGAVFTVPEQTSGTFSHRFDTPGTYTYLCTLHAGMTGTVRVNAAGAASTP